MNNHKMIEQRLLLIHNFLLDAYKDSETKYDLITEVIQGKFDKDDTIEVPDNVIVGDSDLKFTKNDLAGSGKHIIYLGHFKDWNEWSDYISHNIFDKHCLYL